MDEILKFVGILALIALIVLFFMLVTLSFNVNECVAGGYATYRAVKGRSVCLGVSLDGEWEIEPLSDVRERLNEK
jgi:hypothetical protein